MGTLEKIVQGDREILVIDYSNCKEDEMIRLLVRLKDQILLENKPVLIMSVFNDRSYATTGFMRQVEKYTSEVLPLIEKQAMVGLNDIKKFILKGYNLLFAKNYQSFDTKEAAINYLLDKNVSAEITQNYK